MSAIPGQPSAVTDFLESATPEEMRIYTVALQHLAMLMRTGANGGSPSRVTSTLRLLEFYEDVYCPGRSRRSWATDVQMRLTIARFKQLVGDLGVNDICDEHIDQFKRRRQPCSIATVNKDLRNLRAILNFAVRRKYRELPLSIEFEREYLDSKDAWSFDEVRLILASCREQKGKICGIPAADWWTAQQLLILNTGARISAVMQTPWTNYSSQSRVVRIPANVQKHKKDHVEIVHPAVAAALDRI
jgi:hypothetical protein